MKHPYLDAALLKLDWDFDQRDAARDHAPEGFVEIRSGGIAETDEGWPLFCSTPELAVDTFIHALEHYAKGRALVWAHRPEMLGFNITVADRFNTHRALGLRYAVRGNLLAVDKSSKQGAE